MSVASEKKVEVCGTITMHWTARVWPGMPIEEVIECVMAGGPKGMVEVSWAPLGKKVSDGPWVDVRWRYSADDVLVDRSGAGQTEAT